MKGWNIWGWKPCKCVKRGTPGRYRCGNVFNFHFETECRMCRGTRLRPVDENGRVR